MTFQRLNTPSGFPFDDTEGVPYLVRARIDRAEDFLREVRTMLRLPIPAHEMDDCPFSTELALFAVVGGISRTIFPGGQNARDHFRFRTLLVNKYPWDLDPPEGMKPEHAARVLYYAYRNPISHDLATALPLQRKEKRPFARTLKIERFKDNDEDTLERLERSIKYPDYMGPSVRYRASDDTMILLLDGFYWGVRVMIERLTREPQILDRAQKTIESDYGHLRSLGVIRKK